jgi:hypothetical protein
MNNSGGRSAKQQWLEALTPSSATQSGTKQCDVMQSGVRQSASGAESSCPHYFVVCYSLNSIKLIVSGIKNRNNFINGESDLCVIKKQESLKLTHIFAPQ